MPAGWADKELTAAFETALAIIRMAGKEVVDAAPAGDLVEVVMRAMQHAVKADIDRLKGGSCMGGMCDEGPCKCLDDLATAALAAVWMAGYAVVPMSRHPNPADWRYWEGRYRDEAAEVERLKRERIAADTRARLAEGDHKAAEQLLAQVKAENARLREALARIVDHGSAMGPAGTATMLDIARAALAPQEAGQ
jgi:hypothetical protein